MSILTSRGKKERLSLLTKVLVVSIEQHRKQTGGRKRGGGEKGTRSSACCFLDAGSSSRSA